eukprot:UC4_evm1s1018
MTVDYQPLNEDEETIEVGSSDQTQFVKTPCGPQPRDRMKSGIIGVICVAAVCGVVAAVLTTSTGPSPSPSSHSPSPPSTYSFSKSSSKMGSDEKPEDTNKNDDENSKAVLLARANRAIADQGNLATSHPSCSASTQEWQACQAMSQTHTKVAHDLFVNEDDTSDKSFEDKIRDGTFSPTSTDRRRRYARSAEEGMEQFEGSVFTHNGHTMMAGDPSLKIYEGKASRLTDLSFCIAVINEKGCLARVPMGKDRGFVSVLHYSKKPLTSLLNSLEVDVAAIPTDDELPIADVMEDIWHEPTSKEGRRRRNSDWSGSDGSSVVSILGGSPGGVGGGVCGVCVKHAGGKACLA